ncbi:leucine-rich repeat-containing protein 45-like isoform X2 [Babylonia areolata]|uniref:leucine-rich repeat-containing protein 45-like isoform X2 n=1 Tax=Babylonia areolata TaxID=304850 RepID=UPI003FD0FF50
MEDCRLSYMRLCKDHYIDPQECIVEKLKSLQHTGGKGRSILDLSTESLAPKTCAVLGKVLATDRTFTELRFADCMLSEDAVKNLAQGLAYNGYCKKLDLKGNNIRGSGVEALGKMLRYNRSLLSICLEWNGLGMLENSFAVFCEGLAANSTLRALDIRNNQINHEGAEEICAALKRNISLRALEMSVDNNADRQTLTDQHSKQTSAFSQHIKSVEKEKSLQITDLMDQLDLKEEQLRKSKRTSTLHVSHLQETLEERKEAFNSLAAK